MPYSSPAQSRFIHAKASEGVSWAKKFATDSEGTKVPKKPMYNPKLKQQKPKPLGPYGARYASKSGRKVLGRRKKLSPFDPVDPPFGR